MTIETRRAKIQKLIDFKGVAGRSIAADADCLSPAWLKCVGSIRQSGRSGAGKN
jgi:hypothetical protein